MRRALIALAWLIGGLAIITAAWVLLLASPSFGPQLMLSAYLVGVTVCALGVIAFVIGIRLGFAWLASIVPEVLG